MQFIDRRLNPKAKSLGNRQRFLRRAKGEVQRAVKEALKKRRVSEVAASEKVTIPAKSLREPSFSLGSNSGTRDAILPGNKTYSIGDVIPKPPPGGGQGSKGAPNGEGDDDFVFTLTKEEFLDLFFEDLKLPNLIKAKLKSMRSPVLARAGFTSDGPPSKLNQLRTMRNSLARRIALSRPSQATLDGLAAEIEAAEALVPPDAVLIEALRARQKRLIHLKRSVAYVDPIDLRYNRHERRPRPSTQAVMFCLMDVSASMTEPLKDLAKRFFMLLHIFLTRHYREVDVVFIRHTTQAQEVPEEQFFTSTVTGGTIISSALEEMVRILEARYPVADWNIYAAQASDGHNVSEDMAHCIDLLERRLLPACQYFAYIEVVPRGPQGGDSVVWDGYSEVADRHDTFAMRQVSEPGEIYPVFSDLFSADAAALSRS